ncbi:MFS transporter, partial [Enterobacter cloacae]|nr:MFS transporter [Enterobacter cloacae]
MIKFRQLSHIRGQVLSTYLGNFIGGFCIAIWAPLIPFIQKAFSLSNIEMGHMVLLFGIGSVCGMFA